MTTTLRRRRRRDGAVVALRARSKRWVALLVVLAALVWPWSARAAIVVEASPVANLTYQLDCVAGVEVSCGARDAFRDLWRQRFGVDVANDARITRWREVRDRNRGVIGGGQRSRPFFDLQERVRRSSLSARSFEEYYRDLGLLTSAGDAQSAAAVIEAFRPGFEAWWSETAAGALTRKVLALTDALDAPELREELRRIEAFYGSSSQLDSMTVQAVYRPAVDAGTTTAQLVGDYAIAEVPANDSVEMRLPVLVHEYAHRLLARLAATQAAALQRAVITAGRGFGRSAWHLFDEALATAVGNARVGRLLVAEADWKKHVGIERSLYSKAAVDESAKAILSLVDAFIDERRAITDPVFAEQYATAVIGRLGNRLLTPVVFFGELAMVADSALGADVGNVIAKVITQASGGNISMWHWRETCCAASFLKPLADHPDKPHLLVISTQRIASAAFLPQGLRKTLSRTAMPAYAVSRLDGSPLIVIAATSSSGAETAMRAIYAKDALADGVYSARAP